MNNPVNKGILEKDVDLIAIVCRDRSAINFSDVFLQVITVKKRQNCCTYDYFRFSFQAVLQPTLKTKKKVTAVIILSIVTTVTYILIKFHFFQKAL